MFNNIVSALGRVAGLVFPATAAFGAFKSKKEIVVQLTDGHSKCKRSYYTEEDYTAVGHIDVSIAEVVNDPRGFNLHMVDENGYITPELFAAKLTAAGGVERVTNTTMQSDPELFMRADSQVSLLVAVMSTYYVLTARENAIKPALRDYNDGHLKLALIDMLAPQVDNKDWRSEEPPEIRVWDQLHNQGAPDSPVIYCGGLTPKQAHIIAMHAGGRRRTTRFSFDLDIPTLAREVYVAGANVQSTLHLEQRDITSTEVRTSLNKYVAVNRLYSAFEVALAIYQQCALTPLPDHAEGYAWLRRRRELVLPGFDAFRGAYRMLLQQEPYGISTVMSNTWEYWRNHGLGCAVQGGMFTAISLWGRYLAEGGYYHAQAGVRNRLCDQAISEVPGAAYYAYASLITGKNTYCPVPRSFGVNFSPWDDDLLDQLPVTTLDTEMRGYDLITVADEVLLNVRQVPPPCSAIHVLGKMPSDGAFRSLSDNFQVNLRAAKDGWIIPSMDQAWGFAMATRWFGYNIDMQYRGATKIGNWAPNGSSIAARPFFVDGPDIETVRVSNIVSRPRTFGILPLLAESDVTWTVDVAVGDRVQISRMNGFGIATKGLYVPNVKDGDAGLQVRRADEIVYMPVTLLATPRSSRDEAGFQVIGPDIPAAPPDPVPLVAVAVDEPPDLIEASQSAT